MKNLAPSTILIFSLIYFFQNSYLLSWSANIDSYLVIIIFWFSFVFDGICSAYAKICLHELINIS